MFQGFKPVFDENSKILILGSFPSVKSRENGFYYGNPQNRFWKMLATIFNEKTAITIDEKIAFLKKHKIALYDIVSESNLKGSADITLEKSSLTLADISALLPPFTCVEKILCNGKTSFHLLIGKKQIKDSEKFYFDLLNKKTTSIDCLETINKNSNLENRTGLDYKFNKAKEINYINSNSKKISIFCLSSTSSANPRFSISEWAKHIKDID